MKRPSLSSLILLSLPNFVLPSSSESSSSSSFVPSIFVSASPTIAAAVCSDGIAIIATHIDPTGEQFDDVDGGDNSKEECYSESNIDEENNDFLSESFKHGSFRLLPTSYKGPFRIQQIDEYGTVLIAAGWRTDTYALFNRCRTIASKEKNKFGSLNYANNLDKSNPNNVHQQAEEYLRHVAKEASYYMSQCAVSDNVRSLSCVGLICNFNKIYMVDSTGYWNVRALSLGRNSVQINEQLVKTNFLDASSCNNNNMSATKEHGVCKLLNILVQQHHNMTSPTTKASQSETTRYELAVICNNNQRNNKMKRLLSKSSLFGISTN